MASELIVQTLKGPTSGANANKVIIPSGQTLEIDAWTPPAGTVVGYEYFTTTTQQTVSSSSYTATVLQVTINKKYADSSILILAAPHVQAYNSGAGEGRAGARIYNATDSIELYESGTANRSYDGGDVHVVAVTLNLQAVDTTTGTGDKTYRVDLKHTSGSDTRLNIDTSGEARSSIVVMEIAG